jgi:hypothetical protein
VRFVTSTVAPELEEIATRAIGPESLEEYREILTGTQRPGFERLAKAWGVTETDAR